MNPIRISGGPHIGRTAGAAGKRIDEVVSMNEHETEQIQQNISKIKIMMQWDRKNTTRFTSKLYQLVEKKKIEFDLKAKQGSLETEFIVAVASGFTVIVADKIGSYIWKIMYKQKQKDKPMEPVKIVINHNEHLITGSGVDKFPIKKPLSEPYRK